MRFVPVGEHKRLDQADTSTSEKSGTGLSNENSRLVQGLSSTAHGKMSIPNPPQGDHPVRQLLDLFCLAPYNDNLQAVVVVHMNMGGRNDVMVIVVLHLGQPVLQILLVMVVYQADHSHNLFIRQPFLFDEGLADKVADCLGAVGVTSSPDMLIKDVEQVLFKRY